MNMKKFTSLLIICSLALAGAVMAQTPEEQATPKEKPAAAEKTPAAKTHATQAKPGANAAQAQETTAKPEATVAKPQGLRKERATPKVQKAEATPKSEKTTGTETNVSGQPAASATPAAKKEQSPARSKDMKSPAANAKTSPSASPAAAKTTATPAAATTPAAAASASAAPSVSQTSPTNSVNPTAAAKKPDQQKVEQIQQQHMSFHAQPRPDRVPTVTFSANFRIQGSDRWQGPQYEVYRSYHPERHDQGWYHSHYQRVELISGGYYYYNNNYWYPAWGYNSSNEYYAYDAPIYVGKHAQPPDKVIADVQAVLQDMGYYKGEVDGLLGPLTREALTSYQTDQGMVATAVIDEPTLDALGMG